MNIKRNIIHSEIAAKDVKIGDFSVIHADVKIEEAVAIGELSVIGRQPAPTSAMVRQIEAKSNSTTIGKGSSISAGVVIYANVTIGENCLIGDNTSIFTGVTLGNRVLISRNVTINSEVEIGDNTRIMDNSHITGRSKLGKSVFISVGVSTVNDNVFGRGGFNGDVIGCIIGDFVSIGPGVVILPGSKIGMGTVVAAGSVVKGELPEGMLCAGNPAVPLCRVPRQMLRVPEKL